MGVYEQRAYGVSANPIIGGVQYFHQTTKPTTRPNGDALVTGDRWWKTDDGTEWFWNGTYWLGDIVTLGHQHGGSIAYRFTGNSGDVTYSFGSSYSSVFLVSLHLVHWVNGTNDASNYWAAEAVGDFAIRNDVQSISMGTWDTSALSSNERAETIFSLDQVFSGPFDFRPGGWKKVGSPGGLYLAISLKVREIA